MSFADIDTGITQEPAENEGFGDLYIDVRQKEKRVLSDGEVMFLPDIDENHIHFHEWHVRKQSAQRLVEYLKIIDKPLAILEIGCGNGWLSSKLSAIKNSKVTGIDINEPEILQAKRLFRNDNLEFICSGFRAGMLGDRKFDIIVFAASIQYFQSLDDILTSALSCLDERGEIHITDTNFYTPIEAGKAAKRSAEYYTAMGFPEMAAHYFHHTINQARQFNYSILCNPHRLLNLITKRNLFYWIVIKH